MKKYSVIICLLVSSCLYDTSDLEYRDIDLVFRINGKNISTTENLKIRYLYDLNTDTTIRYSRYNKISLPKKVENIQYMDIEWRGYTIDFSGEFLDNELPNLLPQKKTRWYLDIDKSIRANIKKPDLSSIDCIFFIHVDSMRNTGVWVRFDK